MDITTSPQPVTGLLLAWESGDPGALERLVSAVYDDLRRIARNHLRGERRNHTLQATALIHEAFFRLVDQQRVRWTGRAHFFAIAARQMRRILVDHARQRQAAKRGGEGVLLALDEALDVPVTRGVDVVALDDALRAFETFAPRAARGVELRFFSGLTIDETAAALEVSPATVRLDWSLARSWLFRELGGRSRD